MSASDSSKWYCKIDGRTAGPFSMEELRQPSVYYWYYATQVMHHYGGKPWHTWNHVMRDVLIETQHTKGHEAGIWSRGDGHDAAGGRVYLTALALCTLEVYPFTEICVVLNV